MFPIQRNRIDFGTSVFHSYVHNWKCQIEFSPCFNVGWGLSDGEGLERLWYFLHPLISSLQYSTRNHRLGALGHKVAFHNRRGINKLRNVVSLFLFRIPVFLLIHSCVLQRIGLGRSISQQLQSDLRHKTCWLRYSYYQTHTNQANRRTQPIFSNRNGMIK